MNATRQDNETVASPAVPTDADLLAQYLSSHDAPCPACGYNLRGLTESRCPECGYRFAWPELLDPARR